MMLSKLTLHNKPFARLLNQMINCSPVFSAAMTLCATHGVRPGLMSHSHEMGPLCPICSRLSQHAHLSEGSTPVSLAMMTSPLSSSRLEQPRWGLSWAATGHLFPLITQSLLCAGEACGLMDSNETKHFVICQRCSNITTQSKFYNSTLFEAS